MNQSNSLEADCARARAQDQASLCAHRLEIEDELDRLLWLRNKPGAQREGFLAPLSFEPQKRDISSGVALFYLWVSLVVVVVAIVLGAILTIHSARHADATLSHALNSSVSNAPAPRAEPAAIKSSYVAPLVVNCVYSATLPDTWGGAKIPVTYRGVVSEFKAIPPNPNTGDMWVSLDTPAGGWVYWQPAGYAHAIWIDP